MSAPVLDLKSTIGQKWIDISDEDIEEINTEEILSLMSKILKEGIKDVMSKFEEYREDVTDEIKQVINLVNSMELVHIQYDFIIAALRTDSEQPLEQLKKKMLPKSYLHRYEGIKTKEDLSVIPAKHFLVMFNNKMLLQFAKVIKECFKVDNLESVKFVATYKNVSRVKIIMDKFRIAAHHVPYVFGFPKDDVFFHPKVSPVWQDLRRSVTFKQILSKEEITSSFKLLNYALRVLTITIKHHVNNPDAPITTQAYNALFNLVYYGVRPSKAEIQGPLCHIDANIYNAFDTWHITEHPVVAQGIMLITPATGFDERIYVPRWFPAITKEVILKEYEENTSHEIQHLDPKLLTAPDLSSIKDEILEDILINSDDKIQIRILSPEDLHLRQDPNIIRKLRHKAVKYLSTIGPKGTEPEDMERAIVIHIHGGGFVAMTSSTHRLYLNTWVQKLNLIHFCIDYRLSPESQYPEPLDDVWQAYLWIVNYCESILGIKNQKIILAGDSAGGNLAMSLMLRLVKAGHNVPDGCFLLYPNLFVDAESSSPSYFKGVDDIMLPVQLLKLVAHAYVPEGFKNQEDPFIGPMLAGDDLLEKMPPIRMIIGSEDPFYDDTWRLLAKLKKLNRNVKMIVHEGLPHAYLCNPTLKNQNVYIQETIDVIRELIAIKA